MHRIDTPTAQADKFGLGKNGFTNGDPATGRRATDLNSDMWDAVQEEICAVVEKSGLALDKNQHDQLYSAIIKIITSKIPDALIRSKNLSDVVDKVAALANIGGVPTTRKINGHALGADANVTAQDIFNGQVVDIGNAVDLNTLTTPGLYRQAANAQAASGKNYPEANAGSLEVYKHAGITQVYRVYNNSRQYARTLYSGTWSAWGKVYDTNNKPSAADTGALSLGGGTLTGELKIAATNDLRLYNADYGAIFRRSEKALYIIPTAKGQGQNGDIGPLRPLIIQLDTGAVTIGELQLANWTHFDARYYTQTAANGKFQPKGNYTPTGTAYTKAESNSRYPTDLRLGARNYRLMTKGTMFEIAGNVITGLQIEGEVDGDGDYIVMRPLQKQVNGTWYTVSQA